MARIEFDGSRKAFRPGGPSRIPNGPPGHTVLELAVALLILGVLLSLVGPLQASLRDRFSVWQARERTVGLVTRARAEALTWGGARLVVRESPAQLRVEAEDTVLVVLGPEELAGVALGVSGSGGSAILAWDGLGVGRIASRTLRFRRGEAEARLILSSYGRVRRP